MSQHIQLPIAFSEPAQLVLYLRYGDPRKPGWEERWMTEWAIQSRFRWFPKNKLYLHSQFKNILEKVFSQLEVLGLQNEIAKVSKCFDKKTDSKGVLSVHAWGAALDILPQKQYTNMAKWSQPFLKAFQDYHIWCGQTSVHSPQNFHQFCLVSSEPNVSH